MRRTNTRGLRSASAAIVLGIALLPLQSTAGPHGYPKQKPLVFANKLDVDPTPESTTSFNCHRASSRIEHLICAQLSLARADGDLDFSYRLLLHWAEPQDRGTIVDQQRDWLRQRDACPDADCLSNLYGRRSSELSQQIDVQLKRRLRDLAIPGACEVTRIEMIGGRLQEVEGDKPTGMTFVYADGVIQVSYDRNQKALRSRVGDRVRVCLASLPRNCPPGDERGRVYTSYNLRTHARWSLPDAEHRCGGA